MQTCIYLQCLKPQTKYGRTQVNSFTQTCRPSHSTEYVGPTWVVYGLAYYCFQAVVYRCWLVCAGSNLT